MIRDLFYFSFCLSFSALLFLSPFLFVFLAIFISATTNGCYLLCRNYFARYKWLVESEIVSVLEEQYFIEKRAGQI